MKRNLKNAAGKIFPAFLCFSYCTLTVFAQQSQATLRGQVTDPLGGIVVGVLVTAVDASGVEKTATTNEAGEYVFAALPPGRYTIRVNAEGFSPYENANLEITAGRTDPFDIILTVGSAVAEVTIEAEEPFGTEPESNTSALVLRGTDLESLPDDPDDLSEALQALAGPTAGADGEGQIYIDGFSGGRLPPKESIREIRVNRNPFSAEYDRLGYGRIEVFTKPGTDRFRGQAFFNFNDESLNSRSPFSTVRAPYQARRFGGNVSGPLIAGKASYFLDFERRDVDDNRDINAIILDPLLNPISLNETILTPTRRTTFSPRLDWQINDTNTIVARYTFERTNRENEGVGGFNLSSRGYNTRNDQHTLQLTHTTIINQSIINESRFQYVRERRNQQGGTFAPTIRVLDAFTGGGAQVGLSFNNEDRFELQNFTSWTLGNHSLKAGARLRSGHVSNSSQQNFAGTFTFTSLEQYRNALQGNARPTQFSISGGNPEINFTQTDFSPFIQDDWRVRPNLTLSFGLRYDWQNNINSKFNFAPRAAFAWSPGAGGGQGRQQRTVIRGGFGVFYDRFNDTLLSQTERFNGTNQQQFVVTTNSQGGTAVLGLFPNVPTIEQLTAFAIPQTIRQMAGDISTPYTLQTSFSIERQLPYRTTLSVNFVNANTRSVLRTRNINAPQPGTNIRPIPTAGNIFQYESTGRFNQQQLIVSLNNRFSRLFSISANYVLNRAKSDTDGLNTFPANQYDLSGEYGRSSQDVRHRLTLFGSINALPWGIRLSPFVIINSGRPFNITLGRDINGDTLFTERPAVADAQTAAADLRQTPFGDFDINPKPGQSIIPRNFGTGPSFFTTNLRISKTFGFGGEVANQGTQGGRGGRGRGGRRGGGGGRRGGGGAAAGDEGTRSRYNLTVSANIQNLFNNTNEGVPVGNLNSPFFGKSLSSAGGFGRGGGGGAQTAGNRRIDLQLRFSF
ncbi:MAG TPA: TonB-dependent receptor [Pyrinomonadaceae bacterium]